MKKGIYTLLLCCCAYGLLAQDCGEEATGISTNPDNLIQQGNCQPNIFDWRNEFYPAPFYKGSNVDGEIRSPFYEANNGAISELWNYFAYEDAQDMLSEDGWELVADGLTQAPASTLPNTQDIAYFVLYNKFTATLRVFGAHYDIGTNDYMVVYLSFINTSGNNMTGLLSPTQQIAQPLDQKSISQVHANAKIGGNNSLFFFYADFPMGYDPCTCIFDKGNLKVEFQAVNEQTLNIYGRAWALDNSLAQIKNGVNYANPNYLTNVYTTNQTTAGSFIFNTFADLEDHYEKQKNKASKLNEQYQVYKDLKNTLEIAAAAVDGPDGGVGKIKFKTIKGPLKAAAKYVEVLGAPLKKKLDAANQNVEVTGKVRMMQSEMTFSGKITDFTIKDGFEFLLPGRLNNEQKCNDPNLGHQYPYYDEVLGRFALLETPKVEVTQSIPDLNSSSVSLGFEPDEASFKYMFNPAALIDEDETKIFAALVVKGNQASSEGFDLERLESLSNADSTVYISPFVPIECLGSLYPTLGLENAGDYYEVQLRLLIFYEFNAINSEGLKQQAFEVLTYPVDFTYNTQPVLNHQPSLLDNFSDNLTLGTQHFNNSRVIFAWESITINGNLTAASGVEVKITAPEIRVSGGSIGQGITLQDAEYPLICTPLSPVAASNLEDYCGQEGNYQANQDKNPKIVDIKPTKETVKLIPFQSTPNPFTNTFNIEFELESESTTSLMVFDALGRVVETVIANDNLVGGKHQYQIDGSRLERGIYFIRLQTDDNVQTIKVMKQ